MVVALKNLKSFVGKLSIVEKLGSNKSKTEKIQKKFSHLFKKIKSFCRQFSDC